MIQAGILHGLGGMLVVWGLSLNVLAQPEKAPQPTPPLQEISAKIAVDLVTGMMKLRQEINDELLTEPTAAELARLVQKLKKSKTLACNRIAVVDLSGEVLVCEPTDEARRVFERPHYEQLLKQIERTGKEYITQARVDNNQMLTYDLFLPLREKADWESPVIGFFHANIEPVVTMKKSVEAVGLKPNAACYIMSDQGYLLYDSAPRPEDFLEIMEPEQRKLRSNYRIAYDAMLKDAQGKLTFNDLRRNSISMAHHQVEWQQIKMSGSTWVIVHDTVSSRHKKDKENPLTGRWKAKATTGKGAPYPTEFKVGIILEDTWWKLHGEGKDWQLESVGRYLEDQFASSHVKLEDVQKRKIIQVDGIYFPKTDTAELKVYWQSGRRNIRLRRYALERDTEAVKPASADEGEIPLRIFN